MTDNINETNGTQGAAQEEGGAKKAAEQVEIKGFLKAVPAILLALSLFITLCFITGETGKFGSFISSALKGLFSYMAYSIPVLIALHALFFFSDVRRRKILFRIVFSTVTLITLSMIAYIIPNLTSELVFTPGEFYENGKMNIGGGWGVRIKIPQLNVPLKLDIAYPFLNQQDNEKSKVRLHFNVGFTF